MTVEVKRFAAALITVLLVGGSAVQAHAQCGGSIFAYATAKAKWMECAPASAEDFAKTMKTFGLSPIGAVWHCEDTEGSTTVAYIGRFVNISFTPAQHVRLPDAILSSLSAVSRVRLDGPDTMTYEVALETSPLFKSGPVPEGVELVEVALSGEHVMTQCRIGYAPQGAGH